MINRITLLLFIGLAFTQDITIAVLEFEGKGVSQSETSTLTDRLRDEMFKTDIYIVLERGEMDEVLKEQGFQQTGCVTSECAVEVGNMLGVQQMIGGSIGKVGNIYTVSARVIDVETGEVLKSANYDYSGDIGQLLIKGMKEVANRLVIDHSTNKIKIPEAQMYLSKSENKVDKPLTQDLHPGLTEYPNTNRVMNPSQDPVKEQRNLIKLGQTLPTVPSNVFRFSAGANISGETWSLKGQEFALQGIGRHYFDHFTHNDLVRFSSNNDLYHTGTVFLDSVNTVEQWLTQFNTEHNFSLPVFGPQPIDTTRGMAPVGIYSEKREKNTSGTRLMIEYGMSNEITLSVTVPVLGSYTVDQSITDYSIDAIDDAQVLVDYHVNAKNEFNTFMDSNTFNSLRRGLRDTLQLIYDFYYTNNGDYSVAWVFQALDDPINNLLVDSRFIPPGIIEDTVSLADLVSYYYPSQKTGNGIDDVTIGATILLKGKPSWALDDPADALYGQIFVGIPYGQTISPFIETGSKQFKEAKIGTGVSRWSLGLYGNWGLKSKRTGRLFFQTQAQFSTSTTLNTPAVLFSGGHTHPDSILSQIGNTYKFDLGTGFTFRAGGEVETIKNRLRVRAEIFQTYKGKDRFVSKDPEWDSWMEEHVGYTSSFNRLDFKAEVWLMNSISQNRISPVSFDLYAGFSSTLMAENTYSGWNVYSGITTYYQGW